MYIDCIGLYLQFLHSLVSLFEVAVIRGLFAHALPNVLLEPPAPLSHLPFKRGRVRVIDVCGTQAGVQRLDEPLDQADQGPKRKTEARLFYERLAAYGKERRHQPITLKHLPSKSTFGIPSVGGGPPTSTFDSLAFFLNIVGGSVSANTSLQRLLLCVRDHLTTSPQDVARRDHRKKSCCCRCCCC